MKKNQFKYASTAESESRMYNDVKALLINNNITGNMLYNIMLVISETFTNALVHGNKYNPDKLIEITLAVNDDVVYADIIDEGNVDIVKINSRQPSDQMQEGGRGIDLIDYYSDEITMTKSQSTGGLHISLKFNKSRYTQKKLDNK